MTSNCRDLTGRISGRLTVTRRIGTASDGHAVWECLCSCGTKKAISSNSLTRINPVKSCGCMNKTVGQGKVKPGGSWNEGKSYAIGNGKHCYKTRHAWAKAAIRHYGNKCERCGWEEARCDVHHRVHKARGGIHALDNAIVLCPNCHRIKHEEEKAAA